MNINFNKLMLVIVLVVMLTLTVWSLAVVAGMSSQGHPAGTLALSLLALILGFVFYYQTGC